MTSLTRAAAAKAAPEGACSPVESEELRTGGGRAGSNCLTNAAGGRSSLSSADNRFFLSLQASGSLRFFDSTSSQTLWSVGGAAGGGAHTLCIYSNGSLILAGPGNTTVWASGVSKASSGTGVQHLDIADGNLVIKDGSCKVTWMAPLSGWHSTAPGLTC